MCGIERWIGPLALDDEMWAGLTWAGGPGWYEIGPLALQLSAGCRCRCGHEWLTRDKDDKPRVCPKCKSANWDRPKKFERKYKEAARSGGRYP
jgi:hypothetical protein